MIRRMEISDIPRAAEIHVFGWRSAYRGIVSDEYLFTKMLVSKRIEAFTRFIGNASPEQYVYDYNGIIKGFMTIGGCRDDDKPDAFELWGIYIEPLMKRQGVGTELIDFCEGRATRRGYSEICLWVLEDNSAARRFYEKFGYSPDGEKKCIKALEVNEIRYTKAIHLQRFMQTPTV